LRTEFRYSLGRVAREGVYLLGTPPFFAVIEYADAAGCWFDVDFSLREHARNKNASA
jgi:hypothetical protein